MATNDARKTKARPTLFVSASMHEQGHKSEKLLDSSPSEGPID